MAEVRFYHLTRSSLEQVLPALLGRTLAAGERALVCGVEEERLAALDAALWLAPEPDWLPHGGARDGDADLQPIWLATESELAAKGAANGAGFLFLVDGATTPRIAEFARVFDLFDGNDPAAVDAARTRWRAARAAGHAVSYWQQGPKGWEQKA